MSNVLTPTEDFAAWTASNVTVTTHTHAAPSTADPGAGRADTIEDASAAAGFLTSATQTIVNDSSAWTASIYVRKDATTSRFPELLLWFSGGTQNLTGVSFNTATGVIGSPSSVGDVDASGVVDVDADWWRLWIRTANNNTGNTLLRMLIYPASQSTLSVGPNAALTGSIVVWGANQTNTSTLDPYEPLPSYGVTTLPMILIQHA